MLLQQSAIVIERGARSRRPYERLFSAVAVHILRNIIFVDDNNALAALMQIDKDENECRIVDGDASGACSGRKLQKCRDQRSCRSCLWL